MRARVEALSKKIVVLVVLLPIFFLAASPYSITPKSNAAPSAQAAAPQQAAVQKPPLPFVPGSWTIVLLPDTQNYAANYPGLFHLQTQWIVDHIEKFNIIYVFTLGDITNNNRKPQWDRAHSALSRLDGKVPYTIVLGNHDTGPGGTAKTRSTLASQYFPTSRFTDWPTFGGVMEPGSIENSYHLFQAGGQNWLALALEWGPRDQTLDWANKILSQYPDRQAFILTHGYLYSDSTRYDWQSKGADQKWNPHSYKTEGGVNDGQQMWDKLIKNHPNVFMTINGHVLNDGLGFRSDKTPAGHLVQQMLVNYQMKPLGGESWLRLLEFLPDGKTLQVKSYNPLYEKFNTEPDNQFIINLEKTR